MKSCKLIDCGMQIILVAMTCDNNSSTVALVIVMDHRAIYNTK